MVSKNSGGKARAFLCAGALCPSLTALWEVLGHGAAYKSRGKAQKEQEMVVGERSFSASEKEQVGRTNTRWCHAGHGSCCQLPG